MRPEPPRGTGWQGQYIDSSTLGAEAGLKVLCLNARSLGKNEDQISILANETKADILAFQETWQMDDAIKPHLNGYDLIDCTYRKKI